LKRMWVIKFWAFPPRRTVLSALAFCFVINR